MLNLLVQHPKTLIPLQHTPKLLAQHEKSYDTLLVLLLGSIM